MCFLERKNPTIIGYRRHEVKAEGRLAFILSSTATNFGELTSPLVRWKRRHEDHVHMMRGLLFSRPGDRVYVRADGVATSTIMDNASFVRGLYARAGFSVGEVVPFTGDRLRLLREVAMKMPIAPTIYDPQLHRVLGHDRLMNSVRVLNNRFRCMEYLVGRGLDVPRSFVTGCGTLLFGQRGPLESIRFPCFAKGRQGAGGLDVAEIANRREALWFAMRHPLGGIQLQEHLGSEASLCALFAVLPQRLETLMVTQQRIQQGRLHTGNDWPIDASAAEPARSAAEACQALGYVGLLGIDIKTRVCDVNPRHNASNMLAALHERTSGVKKMSLTAKHQQRSPLLKDLPLGDLWYRDGSGILPCEWHSSHGWLSVALVNDHDGGIEREFHRVCPPIQWAA